VGEKTQNVRERKERERARAHLDRSLALLAPSFPCLGSKTVFSSSFLARLGSTFVRVVAFFSSSFSVPKRICVSAFWGSFSSLLSLRHFHQEPTHDSRDSRRGTLFSRLFRSLALLSRALVSSVVVVVNIFLVKFKGNSSLSWEGLGFYIKSNSNDV